MLGSFLTGILILALGYAYPAYECYKSVEKNKPEIDQLRFWCKYWILVVLLIIFERFADLLISWLPFYHEAKLALYVYLWFPRTRGTTYIYDSVVRPYLSANEKDIDRTILEFRARAADSLTVFIQKSTTYGQARFVEIMHYIVAQSQSMRTRHNQQEQQQQQLMKEDEYLKRTPATSSPPLVEARTNTRQRRTRGQSYDLSSGQETEASRVTPTVADSFFAANTSEEDHNYVKVGKDSFADQDDTTFMGDAIRLGSTKLKKTGSSVEEPSSVQ